MLKLLKRKPFQQQSEIYEQRQVKIDSYEAFWDGYLYEGELPPPWLMEFIKTNALNASSTRSYKNKHVRVNRRTLINWPPDQSIGWAGQKKSNSTLSYHYNFISLYTMEHIGRGI